MRHTCMYHTPPPRILAMHAPPRPPPPHMPCSRWRRVRESLAHHFFAVLARVIIFVLWLLLGFPRVTSTNLNETNIRTSERAIEV